MKTSPLEIEVIARAQSAGIDIKLDENSFSLIV
jgi:hypothetical protein